MGSKWGKVKHALGLKTCVHASRELQDSPPPINAAGRFSDALSLSYAVSQAGGPAYNRSTTPTSSSSGLRLSKSSPKSSKGICSICLTSVKPGQGHAIFTAECSHSFHFHCITSNVKHGNHICPVCRAKWKEVPFQNPASDVSRTALRINQISLPQDDTWLTSSQRLPSHQVDPTHYAPSIYQVPEPALFNDDEALDQEPPTTCKADIDVKALDAIIIKTYPEVSAVSKSNSHDNFAILIHLKAPHSSGRLSNGRNETDLSARVQNTRAPIDLVTVLDVSGSMAGTKLALLKRAMSFVIQNLGPLDRLSVISFSSTARRLFPLRRMTDVGKQQGLQAVNSLVSNGGTNIADGLKKGLKVLVDRSCKNPVSSIILLSDGQDTYTINSVGGEHMGIDYQALVPNSINRKNGVGLQIPVHAFGFGTDHDATTMHSISEISGGTFSFVEAEDVIQDAFAQCLGGLLSVVVQEIHVKVECIHPSLHLGSIKAGNYETTMTTNAQMASIHVGDLYADEERDFLVTINIPVEESCNEMSLIKVGCVCRHAITKEVLALEGNEVKILRPEVRGEVVVSFEVDRQQNRLRAAEAMVEARIAADHGDLAGAVSVLESCHTALSETPSARAGDQLCAALCAELKEMKDRMANRRVYEESGRAYVLSGLSSHSWQRATTRGNFTDSTSLLQSYQTPSMVDMVTRSQTLLLASPSRRTLRPAKSFPARSRAC